MTMKVLSIVTQLEAGGAQTVALSLHRELQKRGVDSQMCFLSEKGSAPAAGAAEPA